MKIYYLKDWQFWYDRSYRCWFAAEFDDDGYQIGESINDYSKQGIIESILLQTA